MSERLYTPILKFDDDFQSPIIIAYLVRILNYLPHGQANCLVECRFMALLISDPILSLHPLRQFASIDALVHRFAIPLKTRKAAVTLYPSYFGWGWLGP